MPSKSEGTASWGEVCMASPLPHSQQLAEAPGPSVTTAERQLSSILSEFARTMLTDFPIQSILEHLVARIVQVLPITGAGVTLIDPPQAPRYVAASDLSALAFEKLQSELDEGPCLAAFLSREPVYVDDLLHDERFPSFGPRAVALGLGAVFTFPLRHENTCLGALDLYRGVPGSLSAEEATSAQTLADVVAAYLVNAQARAELQDASDRSHQSPSTTRSRDCQTESFSWSASSMRLCGAVGRGSWWPFSSPISTTSKK